MCSYLNSFTLFISVSGQIRTTIGQAQLLIDQRFRQFSGLIDLSEVYYNYFSLYSILMNERLCLFSFSMNLVHDFLTYFLSGTESSHKNSNVIINFLLL